MSTECLSESEPRKDAGWESGWDHEMFDTEVMSVGAAKTREGNRIGQRELEWEMFRQ